jgi:hypothetical protein
MQVLRPLILGFLVADVCPYLCIISPQVDTKKPRAQKCCPVKLRAEALARIRLRLRLQCLALALDDKGYVVFALPYGVA